MSTHTYAVHLVSHANSLDSLDPKLKAYLQEDRLFKGDKDEILAVTGPDHQALFLGLGEADQVTRADLVTASVKASKKLNQFKAQEAQYYLDESLNLDTEAQAQALLEGYYLADYDFDHYLSKKKERSLKSVNFPQVEAGDFDSVRGLTQGVQVARDLVNFRANDLYPASLAQRVQELFQDLPVQVEVYDQAAIEELGMGALLAVSRASIHEPRLIVMKYLPQEDQPAVGLVGKGVTYDSGGYAIKTASGMKTMNADMGGAGAMIGTLYALAKNEIPQNTIAVVAATENMIDGDAMKNGDIITSMKGTTIEVDNTDAEGRLTLADALYYTATQLEVDRIIDAATLTGAAVVALGDQTTAAMSNDDELFQAIQAASIQVDEPLWQLPLNDHFRDRVKGSFGDLKNSVPGGAGTITAGCFLEHFVEEVPWVHLDIAGTAYHLEAWDIYPAGASGIPVRTLYHYLTTLSE